MAHKEQALHKYYHRDLKLYFQRLNLVLHGTEYNTLRKSGCLGIIPACFQIGGKESHPISLRCQMLVQ